MSANRKLGLMIVIVALTFLANASSISRRTVRRVWGRVERTWMSAVGELVDAGGPKLIFKCIGRGSPTVIMESGLNQPSSSWGIVPGEVARWTRVCVYDRAGVGGSDAGKGPRTSDAIVRELRAAMARKGISGSLVLVGHSFGALNSRLFAARFPADVVGMVLIDPISGEEVERFASLLSKESRDEYLKSVYMNREGVNILASASEVAKAGLPGGFPTTVISGQFDSPTDDPKAPLAELESAWKEVTNKLVSTLPGCKHVKVEYAGHYVQLDQPDVVVESIRKIVEEGRRLSSTATHN